MKKAISTVNALRVDTIPSELTSAKLQLQNVPCWRTIPPVLTQLLFRLLKNPTGVPPVKLLPGPSGRNRRPQRRLHTALPYSNKNYGHCRAFDVTPLRTFESKPTKLPELEAGRWRDVAYPHFRSSFCLFLCIFFSFVYAGTRRHAVKRSRVRTCEGVLERAPERIKQAIR